MTRKEVELVRALAVAYASYHDALAREDRMYRASGIYSWGHWLSHIQDQLGIYMIKQAILDDDIRDAGAHIDRASRQMHLEIST